MAAALPIIANHSERVGRRVMDLQLKLNSVKTARPTEKANPVKIGGVK
jgi:hypothetical protein